jgi:hypothetical protein
MPSFKLSAALLATAIFSMTGRAQYSIDPNSVPLATRSMLDLFDWGVVLMDCSFVVYFADDYLSLALSSTAW